MRRAQRFRPLDELQQKLRTSPPPRADEKGTVFALFAQYLFGARRPVTEGDLRARGVNAVICSRARGITRLTTNASARDDRYLMASATTKGSFLYFRRSGAMGVSMPS